MKIFEFEIPLLICPSKPYRINKLNLIIVSTIIPDAHSEYAHQRTTTKIIIHNTDFNQIKELLKDFVTFINFLNQEAFAFNWLFERSFSEFKRYEKSVKNLDKYVKDSNMHNTWSRSADFNYYPLHELRQYPTKINFRHYFTRFHDLSTEIKLDSELRSLISFFAYDSITRILMSKIYDNSNLHISNSFILLETLVKKEIKNQLDFKSCPNCGAQLPDKKHIKTLIEEFLKKRIKNSETQKRLMLILKKHYSARNIFIHNAKYETTWAKEEKMAKKLGRNEFTFDDEIEHGGAALTGLDLVNSLIRYELLNMLAKKSST